MSRQARLGVPENGRAVTGRQAASAFDTYSRLLLSFCDEFDAAELSVSSLERFEHRVRDVARQLGEEAAVLRQRSGLRVAEPDLAAPVRLARLNDELLLAPLDRLIDEVLPS